MIAKSWVSGCWQGKVGAGVALAGTLSIGVSSVVLAQVVPDNTLGAESSVVTPNVIQGIPSDQIDNGAIRGANLFHSFAQFNVGAGRGAYFTNPAGIENIFSRVTGANRSEILGRLGVLGNANLFLINPKGIVFGPVASLDVEGSFLATTADAVKLGDTGLFSAAQPAESNLLTVSPSAILFNTIAAQPIVNRSQAESAIGQPNSDDGPPGLQVPASQTLALIGGNVLLEGGNLTAAGGRIELGSVAGVGEVSLTPSENRFVLGYGSISDFGNISLSNGAFVDASGEGGGDIQIRGGRLEMAQDSNLWVNTLGVQNGGELLVRATEVVLSDSLLSADVLGTGTGGNLTIDTERLLVRDGAQVSARTSGAGKGGNLSVKASDVQLIGTSADGQSPSRLLAATLRNSTGDAGSLTIQTNTLLVRDGAQVLASTSGAGKGGNLSVNASDVQVIGTSAGGQSPSRLLAATQRNSTGDAGSLTIQTDTLLVRDGAQVNAATFGAGKGGNLSINASDVQLIGTSADNLISSILGTSAQPNSTGDAGSLTIQTNTLLVRDGAQVITGTFGAGKGGNLSINASDVQLIGTSADSQSGSVLGTSAQPNSTGDAGSLTIQTNTLLVRDGAQVITGTSGAGKGGNLSINASDVQLIGTTANGQFPSGLVASAEPNSTGDAGSLTIQTNTLLVRDGAQVNAATFGAGKGGNLSVNASDVQVIGRTAVGRTADGQFPSDLSTSTQPNSTGDSGSLTIQTNTLLVRDGAQVSAATFGAGKGGNLSVNASDVQVIGTGANGQSPNGQSPSDLSASARRNSTGDAGDLTIDTGRLLVRDGAVISSASLGDGTAGNINITARDTLQADNGTISTNTSRSAGGAIAIQAGGIRLISNSDIRTDVDSGADDSGIITLTADSILAFDDSDILAFARDGRGGDITLNTSAFFGENYRPAPGGTNPDSLNNNNRVDINATGAVSGIITIPDVNFIQNSLTELPENQLDTDNLLASSCIVRRNQQTRGSFTVTGTGGLPQRPGDTQMSSFPTVDVATLPSDGTASNTNPNRPWQKGDPIVEPQGVYRLPNGKLVLSRECS